MEERIEFLVRAAGTARRKYIMYKLDFLLISVNRYVGGRAGR